MAAINTTFFQLVAAFFVAFILAHMVTKYFERFERFPSPLVNPGAEPPSMVQGRDYIPHRMKPTAPPGPREPFPSDSDATPRETAPPVMQPMQLRTSAPMQPMQPTPQATVAPQFPYAMTNDDYLSFIVPSETATAAPM